MHKNIRLLQAAFIDGKYTRAIAMTNIWNLFLSGSAGFIGGLVGGAFKWFFPSFKEVKEARQAKQEKKLDTEILKFLSDHQIRKADQIAEAIDKKRDDVIEGLDRLEMRGRVRSDHGTFDDPGKIYWSIDF